MRPSPEDILTQFRQHVDGDTLVSLMSTLRADPNWHVSYLPGPPTWDIDLLYCPTGDRYLIQLARSQRNGQPVWHRVT